MNPEIFLILILYLHLLICPNFLIQVTIIEKFIVSSNNNRRRKIRPDSEIWETLKNYDCLTKTPHKNFKFKGKIIEIDNFDLILVVKLLKSLNS